MISQLGAGGLMQGIEGDLATAMESLRRLSDVLAVAVVRRDGLIISHLLPRGSDPKKVAAMCAALVGTSELASRELGQGRFIQSIVEAEEGKVIATGAGERALVVAIVRPESNMGLVLMTIERATREIEVVLSGT
jgi:predicted regulator of Ras-like GTPase activity (Roadblock/LC7/MglB family)